MLTGRPQRTIALTVMAAAALVTAAWLISRKRRTGTVLKGGEG